MKSIFFPLAFSILISFGNSLFATEEAAPSKDSDALQLLIDRFTKESSLPTSVEEVWLPKGFLQSPKVLDLLSKIVSISPPVLEDVILLGASQDSLQPITAENREQKKADLNQAIRLIYAINHIDWMVRENKSITPIMQYVLLNIFVAPAFQNLSEMILRFYLPTKPELKCFFDSSDSSNVLKPWVSVLVRKIVYDLYLNPTRMPHQEVSHVIDRILRFLNYVVEENKHMELHRSWDKTSNKLNEDKDSQKSWQLDIQHHLWSILLNTRGVSLNTPSFNHKLICSFNEKVNESLTSFKSKSTLLKKAKDAAGKKLPGNIKKMFSEFLGNLGPMNSSLPDAFEELTLIHFLLCTDSSQLLEKKLKATKVELVEQLQKNLNFLLADKGNSRDSQRELQRLYDDAVLLEKPVGELQTILRQILDTHLLPTLPITYFTADWLDQDGLNFDSINSIFLDSNNSLEQLLEFFHKISFWDDKIKSWHRTNFIGTPSVHKPLSYVLVYRPLYLLSQRLLRHPDLANISRNGLSPSGKMVQPWVLKIISCCLLESESDTPEQQLAFILEFLKIVLQEKFSKAILFEQTRAEHKLSTTIWEEECLAFLNPTVAQVLDIGAQQESKALVVGEPKDDERKRPPDYSTSAGVSRVLQNPDKIDAILSQIFPETEDALTVRLSVGVNHFYQVKDLPQDELYKTLFSLRVRFDVLVSCNRDVQNKKQIEEKLRTLEKMGSDSRDRDQLEIELNKKITEAEQFCLKKNSEKSKKEFESEELSVKRNQIEEQLIIEEFSDCAKKKWNLFLQNIEEVNLPSGLRKRIKNFKQEIGKMQQGAIWDAVTIRKAASLEKESYESLMDKENEKATLTMGKMLGSTASADSELLESEVKKKSSVLLGQKSYERCHNQLDMFDSLINIHGIENRNELRLKIQETKEKLKNIWANRRWIEEEKNFFKDIQELDAETARAKTKYEFERERQREIRQKYDQVRSSERALRKSVQDELNKAAHLRREQGTKNHSLAAEDLEVKLPKSDLVTEGVAQEYPRPPFQVPQFFWVPVLWIPVIPVLSIPLSFASYDHTAIFIEQLTAFMTQSPEERNSEFAPLTIELLRTIGLLFEQYFNYKVNSFHWNTIYPLLEQYLEYAQVYLKDSRFQQATLRLLLQEDRKWLIAVIHSLLENPIESQEDEVIVGVNLAEYESGDAVLPIVVKKKELFRPVVFFELTNKYYRPHFEISNDDFVPVKDLLATHRGSPVKVFQHAPFLRFGKIIAEWHLSENPLQEAIISLYWLFDLPLDLQIHQIAHKKLLKNLMMQFCADLKNLTGIELELESSILELDLAPDSMFVGNLHWFSLIWKSIVTSGDVSGEIPTTVSIEAKRVDANQNETKVNFSIQSSEQFTVIDHFILDDGQFSAVIDEVDEDREEEMGELIEVIGRKIKVYKSNKKLTL